MLLLAFIFYSKTTDTSSHHIIRADFAHLSDYLRSERICDLHKLAIFFLLFKTL